MVIKYLLSHTLWTLITIPRSAVTSVYLLEQVKWTGMKEITSVVKHMAKVSPDSHSADDFQLIKQGSLQLEMHLKMRFQQPSM